MMLLAPLLDKRSFTCDLSQDEKSIERNTKTVQIIAILRTDQIQFSFVLIYSIKSPTMLV